jgi:hypothetical protein
MVAARRSLQLLNLALLTASRVYSKENAITVTMGNIPRAGDRRRGQQPIGFPDRRIVDQRVPTPRTEESRIPA